MEDYISCKDCNNKEFIFDKEDEAARVYNKKAKELFGEYAKLNTIDGDDN